MRKRGGWEGRGKDGRRGPEEMEKRTNCEQELQMKLEGVGMTLGRTNEAVSSKGLERLERALDQKVQIRGGDGIKSDHWVTTWKRCEITRRK